MRDDRVQTPSPSCSRLPRFRIGRGALVNLSVTINPAHFPWEAYHLPPHSPGAALDAGVAPLLHAGGPPAAAHSFESRDRRRSGSAGMSDITSAESEDNALSRLADLGTMLRRGDIALALGIMVILLILMTSLFIHAPLEFSAFPTVLLISTMLRLSLNLASTRLILAHGHEGTAAAGHVIEAFGQFVMSGNFVIGIIVFTILVIVNFVVITKGSGRIAEVT